jgi:mannose-6-phosphate isomerase
MLLRIANSPRHYEWGSLTGASQVLGTTPSGLPEAEVWFGTHHASPTQLVDRDGGHETLAQFLAEEHVDTGFVAGRIPFLLKVLSAGQPFSLQG